MIYFSKRLVSRPVCLSIIRTEVIEVGYNIAYNAHAWNSCKLLRYQSTKQKTRINIKQSVNHEQIPTNLDME